MCANHSSLYFGRYETTKSRETVTLHEQKEEEEKKNNLFFSLLCRIFYKCTPNHPIYTLSYLTLTIKC